MGKADEKLNEGKYLHLGGEELNKIEKPKISVIIPVYNSEKYIKRALDSMSGQTFKDFEVIMIDDGSKDASLRIMEEYKERHESWKLVSIENKGVSNARNIGISMARGEYISFMDSDDFVAPDFLETLYNTAKMSDAEIVCCNYYRYWENVGFLIPHILMLSEGIYCSEEVFKYLISDVRMHYYIWNKLWKKSLFSSNGIKFPDMYFEDMVACTNLFYCSKRIAVNSKALYYYTKHKDSITDVMTEKKFKDYIKAYEFIRMFLESKGEYRKYSISHRFLGYRMILESIGILFKIHKENKELSSWIKDLKETINRILYLMGDSFISREVREKTLDISK